MAIITKSDSDQTRTLAVVAGVGAFRFCLRRLLLELFSDLPRLLIVLLQPAIIGLALSLFSSDISTSYFMAYTAVGWFGLRNGQINVEHEMRQLKRHGVLVTGKIGRFIAHVSFSGFVTTVQTIVLFAALAIRNLWLPGIWVFAVVAVVILGWIAAVGWLLLSLFLDSQKLLSNFIPVLVILQMLSSGFVIPTQDMAPWQLFFCNWTPAFATERIIDLSLLSGHKLSGELVRDYPIPYFNINDWHRKLTGETLRTGTVIYFTDLFAYSFSVLTAWLFALSLCGVATCSIRQRSADRSDASRSRNRGYT